MIATTMIRIAFLQASLLMLTCDACLQVISMHMLPYLEHTLSDAELNVSTIKYADVRSIARTWQCLT